MEIKSISYCLSFNDSMILCGIEKHVGIRNLEDVRDYMIGTYNDKYIEGTVSMLAKLSQISLIKDIFF